MGPPVRLVCASVRAGPDSPAPLARRSPQCAGLQLRPLGCAAWGTAAAGSPAAAQAKAEGAVSLRGPVCELCDACLSRVVSLLSRRAHRPPRCAGLSCAVWCPAQQPSALPRSTAHSHSFERFNLRRTLLLSETQQHALAGTRTRLCPPPVVAVPHRPSPLQPPSPCQAKDPRERRKRRR
jgi:hypothetical protein